MPTQWPGSPTSSCWWSCAWPPPGGTRTGTCGGIGQQADIPVDEETTGQTSSVDKALDTEGCRVDNIDERQHHR